MDWPPFNKDIMNMQKEVRDPTFSAKFFDIPYYLSLHTEDIGYLTGKRVLDFGCNSGETACGTALFHNPSLILGGEFGEPWARLGDTIAKSVGLNTLPPNLAFSSFEADYQLPETEFHFVYSWGALASVPRAMLPTVVARIYERLRIGGRALIQISPLYLSARGSQLGEPSLGNWDHLLLNTAELRSQFFAKSDASEAAKTARWRYFENLSRVTPAEILDVFLQAGFYNIRQREYFLDIEPPEDLQKKFAVEDLKRNQVIFLFGKA